MGSYTPFYLGCLALHFGVVCLGEMYLGIACLTSITPDWSGVSWDSLVLPGIGYPLFSVHPSKTIVTLVMIGYCCNCLDGHLNYWTSTHWLNAA